MYEAVVVPLDGSDASWRAIDTAVLLGRAWTVPVQLVTVVSPGVNTLEATLALEKATSEVDVPVRPAVVLASNDVAATLAGFVRDTKGLLCLATHGRSAIGSVVMGSTAMALLEAADDPVLLVGPHAVASPEVHDLCVAVEPGSAASSWAIPVAIGWARASGARLHLLAAVGGLDELLVGEDEARDDLAAASRRCRDEGVPTCWRVVPGDDVADRLLDVAAKVPASVLVVATHRRRALSRLALGSVAQQLVRRATCPVLAVPPPRT